MYSYGILSPRIRVVSDTRTARNRNPLFREGFRDKWLELKTLARVCVCMKQIHISAKLHPLTPSFC